MFHFIISSVKKKHYNYKTTSQQDFDNINKIYILYFFVISDQKVVTYHFCIVKDLFSKNLKIYSRILFV